MGVPVLRLWAGHAAEQPSDFQVSGVSAMWHVLHCLRSCSNRVPFDWRGFHHLIYPINGVLARAAPKNTAYVGGVLLQNWCL